MSTSTSHMLSMDFDHKSQFGESALDSSFNYMDSGLDYFQYPDSSPNMGVTVGLPPSNSTMDFTLNAMNDYPYPPFGGQSPPRPFSPEPSLLTYHLSPAELSSDTAGRISRGSNSRSPSDLSAVPRSQHRYNPIAAPPNRPARVVAQKRSRSAKANDDSDDDDDEEFKPTGTIAGNTDSTSAPRDSRRETVRKQRIESEQRRRDELREGYARLKDTLPASNQKASKVSLLDRATSHIKYLEAVKDQLEVRLKGSEHEVHRLRSVNEALMLNRAVTVPAKNLPSTPTAGYNN